MQEPGCQVAVEKERVGVGWGGVGGGHWEVGERFLGLYFGED